MLNNALLLLLCINAASINRHQMLESIKLKVLLYDDEHSEFNLIQI